MFLSLLFILAWVFGLVNTDYDWIIFALLVIGDNIDWAARKLEKK